MTDRVNNIDDLQKRIAHLQQTEKIKIAELRSTASQLTQSIAPGNLIKNAFSTIGSSANLRTTLLDTAIGLGAGFVGKKLFVGKSRNIFKKLGGTAIKYILANVVRKKIPALRGKIHTGNGLEK
ncbi:MAG TPA: hypothetical protein VMZ03_07920 [Chitinophagaceae bacterium]|nr:hypothetical protein [Chitinophagaceae bacterium]